MAAAYSASSVLIFLIGLIVSTIVIYVVSRFIGTKRGLKVAFFYCHNWLANLCYRLFSGRERFGRCDLGRDSVAFGTKRFVQNRMDSRFDNGNYHLDYYFFCWSFVTHCPRTSMISVDRDERAYLTYAAKVSAFLLIIK